MKKSMEKQAGFTIIELIIVIAIIAILAVIAIPTYLKLTTPAQTSTLGGVAGALSAANASNYAARNYSTSYGSAVSNCTNVAALLQGGALPSGYTITSLAVAVDATATCTLTGPSSMTTSFTATGVN